jgi:hypothetical protein
MDLIWGKREAIYFCGKGRTGLLKNCLSGKSVDLSCFNLDHVPGLEGQPTILLATPTSRYGHFF